MLAWPWQPGVQHTVGTQKLVVGYYKLMCNMYLCLKHCPKGGVHTLWVFTRMQVLLVSPPEGKETEAQP